MIEGYKVKRGRKQRVVIEMPLEQARIIRNRLRESDELIPTALALLAAIDIALSTPATRQ